MEDKKVTLTIELQISEIDIIERLIKVAEFRTNKEWNNSSIVSEVLAYYIDSPVCSIENKKVKMKTLKSYLLYGMDE